MKKSVLLIAFAISSQIFAQKYFTKTGKTEFVASVDTFEPVEAINNSSTAILNISNGDVAALLFINAFHFDIALMEEHFNENYMESNSFPKAKLTGNLKGFHMDKLNENYQEFQLQAKLTIKGITQEIDTPVKLKLENDKILVESELTVQAEDFGIKIPKIVREKIAKDIHISLAYELVEKK
jgi:polyisoprenoid-binding protein YceI